MVCFAVENSKKLVLETDLGLLLDALGTFRVKRVMGEQGAVSNPDQATEGLH